MTLQNDFINTFCEINLEKDPVLLVFEVPLPNQEREHLDRF